MGMGMRLADRCSIPPLSSFFRGKDLQACRPPPRLDRFHKGLCDPLGTHLVGEAFIVVAQANQRSLQGSKSISGIVPSSLLLLPVCRSGNNILTTRYLFPINENGEPSQVSKDGDMVLVGDNGNITGV